MFLVERSGVAIAKKGWQRICPGHKGQSYSAPFC